MKTIQDRGCPLPSQPCFDPKILQSYDYPLELSDDPMGDFDDIYPSTAPNNYEISQQRGHYEEFQGYRGPRQIPDDPEIFYTDNLSDEVERFRLSEDSPSNLPVINSPFELKDDKYVAKTGSVIDVATFSSSILFLLTDGRIIRKRISDGAKDIVSSNIKAVRLESFGGYLYAVFMGKLYQLNNTSYEMSVWEWKPVSWAPDEIVYTSTNSTKDYLWLQTTKLSYLYDKNLSQINTVRIPSELRRKYGPSTDHYVDYNPSICQATLYQNGQKTTLSDVCAVTYDQYGQPVELKRTQRKDFREIRILNWKPYYIPV